MSLLHPIISALKKKIINFGASCVITSYSCSAKYVRQNFLYKSWLIFFWFIYSTSVNLPICTYLWMVWLDFDYSLHFGDHFDLIYFKLVAHHCVLDSHAEIVIPMHNISFFFICNYYVKLGGVLSTPLPQFIIMQPLLFVGVSMPMISWGIDLTWISLILDVYFITSHELTNYCKMKRMKILSTNIIIVH